MADRKHRPEGPVGPATRGTGGTTATPTRLSERDVRVLLDAAAATVPAGAAGGQEVRCRCRPDGDRIEVWAGEGAGAGRPDRQVAIGCGVAVLNLRLALAHLGFEPRVAYCPPGPHLVTVAPGPTRAPTPDTEALYAALTGRTDAGHAPARRLDRDLRHRLHRAARAEGVTLHEVHTAEQRGLLGGALHRADSAERTGRAGAERPAGPRTAFLVTTTGDGPQDWLHAGQALQRMRLTGRLAGVEVDRPDQPVAVRALRDLLPRMPDVPRAAQLLVWVDGAGPARPGPGPGPG